jgi:hypothetical protein
MDRRPNERSSSIGNFFLEKELHRRYSERELHNNKGSVPYLRSQGCGVLLKKRKMTKHENLNLTFLQLNCSKEDSRRTTQPPQQTSGDCSSTNIGCLL